MKIYKIKKRNGTIVTFDRNKIVSAISRAAASQAIDDMSYVDEVCAEVFSQLKKAYANTIPDVESVQDIIEEILMKSRHESVAKAYILYREEHKKQRQEKKKVMLDVETTVEEYLSKSDWRINANANSGYSL